MRVPPEQRRHMQHAGTPRQFDELILQNFSGVQIRINLVPSWTDLINGQLGGQITSARWTADEDARNQLVINDMRAAELPTTGSDRRCLWWLKWDG